MTLTTSLSMFFSLSTRSSLGCSIVHNCLVSVVSLGWTISLSFMSWQFLKTPVSLSTLLFRIRCSWFVWCFPVIRFRFWFPAQNAPWVCVSYPEAPSVHLPLIGDAHFDYLFVDFSTVQLLFVSLETSKPPVGRQFRVMQTSCSSSSLPGSPAWQEQRPVMILAWTTLNSASSNMVTFQVPRFLPCPWQCHAVLCNEEPSLLPHWLTDSLVSIHGFLYFSMVCNPLLSVWCWDCSDWMVAVPSSWLFCHGDMSVLFIWALLYWLAPCACSTPALAPAISAKTCDSFECGIVLEMKVWVLVGSRLWSFTASWPFEQR